MAKIIDKIIQSATEPSKNDLWLHEGSLKANLKGKWESIGGGSGGGVTIVDSVDKLDENAPVGNLAVVAKQGGRTISSFRDLVQPNVDMINANVGTINTAGLSIVNDLQITPPTAPTPVDNLSELNLYFVSSNYGMEDTRKMLQINVYADNETIALAARINGGSFIDLFGISSNPDIFDTNYVNNDGITEVLDFIKNNELYYVSDIDRIIEGVEIENEWFDILDSIIRPIQETETKAEIYLKEEDYLPIRIPQYSSKSSLIASNPKLGQISAIVSSTIEEKTWNDLYVPNVVDIAADAEDKMSNRMALDRVYSVRDVGLSTLIGMSYQEAGEMCSQSAVIFRKRNAVLKDPIMFFLGFACSSFGGDENYIFVKLNGLSKDEFLASGQDTDSAIITDVDYDQLAAFNNFLKENDVVYLEMMGIGVSTPESLEALSQLVSPNILVENNDLYVNTEYGLLPITCNEKLKNFKTTISSFQKIPYYTKEDSTKFAECLINGGITSWIQTSKKDVELRCGSFGKNPIETFTFYLYNVNSIKVMNTTQSTVDISSEVHWETALPESFEVNTMYKVVITFIYVDGLTDNRYIMGTCTKF